MGCLYFLCFLFVSSNKYICYPMPAILVVCFYTPSGLQCDIQSNLEHSLSKFGNLENLDLDQTDPVLLCFEQLG